MSKAWKRFLSLLLAATMVLPLGVTGFALDETDDTAGPADGTEPSIVLVPDDAEEAEDGIQLETEDISPDKLGVRKLGLEEAEEEELEGNIAIVGKDGQILAMEDEDLDTPVRVSIFLDAPSTIAAGFAGETAGTNAAAISYRDGLRAQHETMKAQIAAVLGHELDVVWDLTLTVNAISAYVTPLEIVKIEELAGVRSVQRENQYMPMAGEDDSAEPNTANTSENMVGAVEAWTQGYTGAGSRIAIIDTGIDTAHQSFAEGPFLYSVGQVGATDELMTQADISAVLSQLNAKDKMSSVTAAQLNQNGQKIVYGFNYIDKNTTIDHRSDTQGNHGSHVAGIAAANRYIGSDHKDAAATVGAVGMAPDAQLLVMKVFGAGGGAYDSDYMVAIEDAMILGADVANLSLGSGDPGFTFSNEYQDLVLGWADGEHNQKMVLTISAGNSYDFAYATPSRDLYIEDVNMHTGGTPGTLLNSLCVAAAQNTLTTGTPMIFNGDQKVFYYESTGNEEEGTTYTNPALTTIAGTYDYVYIDATGTAADYSTINSAVSLSGKVVIVNRGDISFVEKGENAKSYSPKAVIIANNQDGVIYMDLSDFTGTFPMVTITLKDAEQIKAGGTAHTVSGITYYTGSMQVTNKEVSVLIDRSAATITDFSSWGVPGSLLMKPEITAPGGDIYSVYGTANKTSGGTEGGTDQYVSYSGTSMAAPHMAGLTGVLAEYLRENDVTEMNTELADFSARAITQSLLMSTATPMKPEGEYLSILQQGAGLADVSLAVNAKSVIMMDPANSGLTGLTGAAEDGKVKFEFGDDPDRSGVYSYSFTIYNLTDEILSFDMSTELFTQAIKGGEFMSRGTELLSTNAATYVWGPVDGNVPESHDVDRDGDTDNDDAQAILDLLSYEKERSDLGWSEEDDTELLAAADMDGDEAITSYDAYLLLDWEPEESVALGDGQVPANRSRKVTVTISLGDEIKGYLDDNYPGGAYIQAFTYAKCTTADKEGVSYAHTHSIPVLGFYGSWTDASMFDTNSFVEQLYGNEQLAYSGNANTNYLRIQQNGANLYYTGNPYMVEDEFPANRLAINSSTVMQQLAYNLIRSAGTTGYAVSKLDEDGNVTDVVSSTVTDNEIDGQWYYVNGASWQNTGMKIHSIGKAPSAYGLTAGDRFRVGFYAIPEYNAMVVNNDYTSTDAGKLDKSGFDTLLKSNVLGKGAFVGYDFVVDNKEPVIGDATLSGNQLTVSATDNEALAYVAVLSLDGLTKYAEAAPGTDSFSISFDATDAIANAFGYVAVFAGDYAGNESAMAVKVNDNDHIERTIYIQTNTITAGEEYVIANTSTVGPAYVLGHRTTTTLTNAVTVKAGDSGTDGQPYIASEDVASTSVWTVGSGNTNGTWTFSNDGYYLRRSNTNNLTITTDASRRDWTWDGTNNRLSINYRYLRYYNNTFSLNAETNSVYLFQKVEQVFDIDPDAITEVTITPETLDLYKGNTADLTAKVLPLTASDRTVTWTSSNTGVATVDAYGKVTAVAAGTATITATANGDSTKSATCSVTVTAVDKTLNAIVWDADGKVYFSSFNANNLPTWKKLSGEVKVGDNPLYLHNAYMYNNSTLYASTCDISDTSVLYTVNRSTYALTEFGTNYLPAFGMARGMTGFISQGYKFFAYAFAKYLILGNLDPDHEDPKDSSSAMYSGLPYALLDLTTTSVGDAYAVAICAKSVGSNDSSYYFLDETGKIWETTASYSSGFSFSDPTLVVDTGLSAGLQYQSLYFDGTYIYWSRQTDNESQLVIYNAFTDKLYLNAGNFGEGVWPAAGLYVNGAQAPNSVGDELAIESLDLKPVATYNDLMTADVRARLEAAYGGTIEFREPLETEEPAINEDETPVLTPADDPDEGEDEGEIGIIDPVEPAPVADEGQGLLGRLTSLRIPGIHFAAPSISVVDPNAVGGTFNEEHAREVTVSVAETADSHNGVIALVYDPEVAAFVSFEGNEDVRRLSVHVDEKKGVITIAYANKIRDDETDILGMRGDTSDMIPAGTSIVDLRFTIDCNDSEGEITTLERNEEFDMNDMKDLVILGSDHPWGEPTWTWTETEDGYTATATFVCENDASHTKTVNATITSETVGRETTYTATVELDGQTYTATKTVVSTGITLSFNAGEGTVEPATKEVTAGEAVGELPVPTREGGWVFIGWFTEAAETAFTAGQGTQVTAETVLEDDTTVYAHWRLPGDINGDGKVNNKDWNLLMKYVKYNEGTVVEINLDVTGDGKVNNKDWNLLLKFVKYGGVEIH